MSTTRYTLQDVAQKAGASVATVSRALRAKPGVGSVKADAICRIARQMGYLAGKQSAAAARGRTMSLGLLLNQTLVTGVVASDPWTSCMIDAYRRETEASGYNASIEICPITRQALMPDGALGRHDGLLLLGYFTSEQAQLIDEAGTAYVCLGSEIHGHKHSWIAADNARGIKEALDHLLLLGHRHIALMHGNLKWRSPKEHLAAFKEHLADQLQPPPSEYIITCEDGNMTHRNGYDMTQQLMSLQSPPTAIICGNDWSAIGVMTKLTELNLRVPQDMSIISCAQTQLSTEHAIPLTGITRDYDMHLRRATGMLMTLIQNPGRVLHERLEPPLVKRQSTGPVKQPDQSAQSNRN